MEGFGRRSLGRSSNGSGDRLARVAQSAEQRTRNAQVRGSSPLSGSISGAVRCAMHPDQVTDVINGALIGRRLLEHPFYRRWEAGQLAEGELAGYAEQYRHVEAALPQVLRSVVEQLPDGAARDLVAANLADEEGVPEPHVTLFETFATAVGARPETAPSAATAALVGLQRSTAEADPVAALAVIAAYEVQAGAVALTKAAGLAEHYGVDDRGTRFWDVHAAMEAEHATWSLDALALLCGEAGELSAPAIAAAQAWWGFLDEREALAPACALAPIADRAAPE